MSWMSDAACKGCSDPIADWFADTGTIQFQRAVEICNACPVSVDCLSLALKSDEQWGVWGGKSARERDWMQRSRRLVRLR